MGQITGNASCDSKINKSKKWKEAKWERCRSNGEMRANLYREKNSIGDPGKRDVAQCRIDEMSKRGASPRK